MIMHEDEYEDEKWKFVYPVKVKCVCPDHPKPWREFRIRFKLDTIVTDANITDDNEFDFGTCDKEDDESAIFSEKKTHLRLIFGL